MNNNNSKESFYCKRIWLNKEDSPSTGSLVCFDGILEDDENLHHQMFVELGSCNTKARIHKIFEDTPAEFLEKIILVRDNLNSFIQHIEKGLKEGLY